MPLCSSALFALVLRTAATVEEKSIEITGNTKLLHVALPRRPVEDRYYPEGSGTTSRTLASGVPRVSIHIRTRSLPLLQLTAETAPSTNQGAEDLVWCSLLRVTNAKDFSYFFPLLLPSFFSGGAIYSVFSSWGDTFSFLGLFHTWGECRIYGTYDKKTAFWRISQVI